MPLRAKKPEAIEKRLKLFVYGAAKVGKTTCAIQFPTPYLIDTERGAENDQYIALLNQSGGAVFQTNDYEELIAELMALLTESHDYKTVVIDPLTTIYNDLLEKGEAEVGDSFGKHYGWAAKKMKRLYNLILRLDMNVIITSHAKNRYEVVQGDKKDAMVDLGQTFDCYKKMDYLFDLVLEVQKRGKERYAIVKGSRLTGFQEDEQFVFAYDEIARRYGRDILERDTQPIVLASHAQINELKRLINLLNLESDIIEKWLKKASAANFDEMDTETIQKCIEHLKQTITEGETS